MTSMSVCLPFLYIWRKKLLAWVFSHPRIAILYMDYLRYWNKVLPKNQYLMGSGFCACITSMSSIALLAFSGVTYKGAPFMMVSYIWL